MDSSKTNKQLEANKRWIDKNREHANYLRSKSSARSFIRNRATKDDIEELQKLIEERLKKLEC